METRMNEDPTADVAPQQAVSGARQPPSSAGRTLLRGSAPGRPRMIANFAVTYRCSSRCRTCKIWQMPDAGRDELSLEEIRGIFEANRGFLRDVTSMQLTGGEPFLRAGMSPRTIERATREMLEVLGGRGLGISVSIDGIAETHDAMRGIKDSYSKAVETLGRLAAVRKEHPGLRLTVGMTLTPENYRELWEVFTLSGRHGAEFSFRPVNFSDIYYRNIGGGFDLGDALGEVVPVVRRIARLHVERRGLLRATPTLRYIQGVLDYVRDPHARRLPCSAASDSFYLDPRGNVYPCIIMDLKMGNVRERPLEVIWASEEAREARRRIRKGLCPGCWVECETFRDIHRDRLGLLSTALRALLHPSTAGIS